MAVLERARRWRRATRKSQGLSAEDAVSRALHQLRGSLNGVKPSQFRRGGGRHIVDEPARGDFVVNTPLV